jgi:glycosyltransferase involved in cell wall biosynthesis
MKIMKKSNPLVSVVIACFNSERYLRASLDSVLAQTLDDFEIITVDDCSTDSTPEILKEYTERDRRVVVVRHEKNSGRPAFSKNTALGIVRGKYISFLDHDDLYWPDKLRVSVDMLEKHPECVASFHDIELVDNDGNVLSRYLDGFIEKAHDYLEPGEDGYYVSNDDFYKFQSIHYAALHTISTMICPERLAGKNFLFDVRYQVCDDTDLWIRLGMAGKIAYSPDVFALYRQHATNITQDISKFDRDVILLLRNNYARVASRLSVSEEAALRARISDTLSNQGWHLRCAGRKLDAICAYAEAWRWTPCAAHVVNAMKALFPPRQK